MLVVRKRLPECDFGLLPHKLSSPASRLGLAKSFTEKSERNPCQCGDFIPTRMDSQVQQTQRCSGLDIWMQRRQLSPELRGSSHIRGIVPQKYVPPGFADLNQKGFARREATLIVNIDRLEGRNPRSMITRHCRSCDIKCVGSFALTIERHRETVAGATIVADQTETELCIAHSWSLVSRWSRTSLLISLWKSAGARFGRH